MMKKICRVLLFIAAINITHLFPSKNVHIIAPHWGDIFSENPHTYNRNEGNRPILLLRKVLKKRGYNLLQDLTPLSIKEAHAILWFDIIPSLIPHLETHSPDKQLLFIWEPPLVSPNSYISEYHKCFSTVYTWHDQLVQSGAPYKKFHYPRLRMPIKESIPFGQRKLVTMIYADIHNSGPRELKSERKKAIRFFESYCPEQFDLFGRHWKPTQWPSYKGSVLFKHDTMKLYKFFICYENSEEPGYVTEKILDCFHAGCVPVYLGAPNIEKYIPRSCFIDARKFNSYESLVKYLQAMNEETFQRYIEAAHHYCTSSDAYAFSIEQFVETVLSAIDS